MATGIDLIDRVVNMYNQYQLNDDLTPTKLKQKQNDLLKDKDYIKLKKDAQFWMANALHNKNKKELKDQCIDLYKTCSEMKPYLIFQVCTSLKRIQAIIRVYKYLMSTYRRIWTTASIGSLVSTDQYGYQQLVDDFLQFRFYDMSHNKIQMYSVQVIHITNDLSVNNQIATILCTRFEQEYPCDLTSCLVTKRHYRERTNDDQEQKLYAHNVRSNQIIQMSKFNNKDIVFQQECDKIHSYFLHSSIKYGNNDNRIDAHPITAPHQQTQDNMNSNDDNKQQFNISESWWNKMNDYSNDNDLSRFLVKSYGIFSSQSSHGFRAGTTQSLSQLKPKFVNIKQEVLNNNKYHSLSPHNWNQTLQKSKAFFQSWARNKIRTLDFDDYSLSECKSNIFNDLLSNNIISICHFDQQYELLNDNMNIKKVNQLFLETMKDKIDKMHIFKIDKNYSHNLLIYNNLLSLMSNKKEDILFHGTSFENINNIIHNGFNRDYNELSLYGKGTYFAKTASFASDYCVKHKNQDYNYYAMLACKVIIGNYNVGSSYMNDNELYNYNLKQYDSLVNDIDNPTIFVINRDYHAIPVYIILFNYKPDIDDDPDDIFVNMINFNLSRPFQFNSSRSHRIMATTINKPIKIISINPIPPSLLNFFKQPQPTVPQPIYPGHYAKITGVKYGNLNGKTVKIIKKIKKKKKWQVKIKNTNAKLVVEECNLSPFVYSNNNNNNNQKQLKRNKKPSKYLQTKKSTKHYNKGNKYAHHRSRFYSARQNWRK